MILEIEWRLVQSMTGSGGSFLNYEDESGEFFSEFYSKNGHDQRVFMFKSDPQKRAFDNEVDLIQAFKEKTRCPTCGAIRPPEFWNRKYDG